MEAAYTYRARILRVIDGDTYDVAVDVGFRLTATLPLRLARVNCPEKRTPEGVRAAAYVAALFSPLPCPVVVRTFKPVDDFGRYLADVYLGDVDLGQRLLETGHAVEYHR